MSKKKTDLTEKENVQAEDTAKKKIIRPPRQVPHTELEMPAK
jgi:hypothetical protein